ncbi:hypothetical protein AAC387_Pa10g0192 [Persea americana]
MLRLCRLPLLLLWPWPLLLLPLLSRPLLPLWPRSTLLFLPLLPSQSTTRLLAPFQGEKVGSTLQRPQRSAGLRRGRWSTLLIVAIAR